MRNALKWETYLRVLLLLHALFKRQPCSSALINLPPEIRCHSLVCYVISRTTLGIKLTLYVSSGVGTVAISASNDPVSALRQLELTSNPAHRATKHSLNRQL